MLQSSLPHSLGLCTHVGLNLLILLTLLLLLWLVSSGSGVLLLLLLFLEEFSFLDDLTELKFVKQLVNICLGFNDS